MLRSPLLPRANSQAVMPLMTMPTAGHGHDRHARHRLRIAEPLDRLERDGADRDEQENGVEQSRQDRRAAQSEGKMRAALALRQRRRAPRQQQPEHVRQIVAGVGQQGDRIGHQPVKGLDRDEAQIEDDADQEGAAEILRGMIVMMPVGVIPVRVVRVRVGGQISSCRAPR